METLDFLFPNVDEEEDAGVDDSSASVASATSSHIVVQLCLENVQLFHTTQIKQF